MLNTVTAPLAQSETVARKGAFAEPKLRHRCRHCQSKLSEPASNPREAFCSKGCHSSFYRKRCLSCECEMDRKAGNQLVCGKRECRNSLRANAFMYPYSPDVNSDSKSPLTTGTKTGTAGDRAWRFVAGPPLSASQLHCATLGGEAAVDAINRTNLRHWQGAKPPQRQDAEVHEELKPPVSPVDDPDFVSSFLNDDLSIPDLLRVIQ